MSTMRKGCLLMVFMVTHAVFSFSQTQRAMIPFQGQLTNQAGAPLEITAPLTLALRLYDAPVGGMPIWNEVQTNTAIIAGRFSILLGTRSPLPKLDLFNKTLYLGITLDDGDPVTVDVEMRPRQALVPVISAFHASDAEKLNGHDWGDLLTGSDPTSAKVRPEKIDTGFLDSAIFGTDGTKVTVNAGSILTSHIATGAISTDKLAANSVSTSKILDGAVTPEKRSPLNFAASSHNSAGVQGQDATQWVDVPQLSVSLTTTGRPVLVGLIAQAGPPPQGNSGAEAFGPTTVNNGRGLWAIRILRDGSVRIAESGINVEVIGHTTGGVPGILSLDLKQLSIPPNFLTIDEPAAGTHQYRFQIRLQDVNAANNTWFGLGGSRLVALEL